VFIGIDEKLTVVLSKTGGLESLEVQGTMSLVVGSDADAYVAVQVQRTTQEPNNVVYTSHSCCAHQCVMEVAVCLLFEHVCT
jgi:hypothetical protein